MNKEIINTVIRNRKSIYPKDYSGEEIPDIVIKDGNRNTFYSRVS